MIYVCLNLASYYVGKKSFKFTNKYFLHHVISCLLNKHKIFVSITDSQQIISSVLYVKLLNSGFYNVLISDMQDHIEVLI